MKNKQINKFLFMFIIGMSLLFNAAYANADIIKQGNNIFDTNGWGATSDSLTSPNFGLSTSEIVSPLLNMMTLLPDEPFYMDDEVESILNQLIDFYNDYYGLSYDSYFIRRYNQTSGFDLYLFNSSDAEFFIPSASQGSFGYSFLEGSNFIVLRNRNNGLTSLGGSRYLDFYADTCYFSNTEKDFSAMPFRTNTTVKMINSYTYNSSTKQYDFYWDGSYYQKAEESEDPSFNHDLAGLISAITSSDVIKDNIDKLRTEYFIIYTGEAFGEYFYDVYFYDNRIQLAYFEYLDENDRLRYDLNKLFIDGKIESIVSSVLGERLDEWLDNFHFKLSYNPGTKNCSVKYVGTKNYADDLEGFSVELTPLVFTSKDIPYYFYEYDEITNQGIATPDTSKDIKTQVIVDSEGNEISSNIENESFSLDETPWTRFVSIIQSIPENIRNAISEMTGLTKIVTLISPIGSAILIILGVLLSSIAFLGRAIAFVYKLPTIQASDALFLADVDSTTGLVFTGNSWGSKFLEGLNMVKDLSWNGLNLWTLFTSFIVAMFAIHCVKIVRKHYHY